MELTREQILAERIEWYSKTFVLLEIVKCLKNRELCFLSSKNELSKKAVRYLLGMSCDFIKKHMTWFNFLKSNINIYHSTALLKPIVPVFSYNLEERKKSEAYQNFDKNYADFVEGYNFFVDFDIKGDFEKGFVEAKEFKKILDSYKLPYYVLNSSFQGFHFCIEAKYLPKMPINELITLIREVIYNLKGIYSLSKLDDSITDLKRVQKCPYSYVDGAVALPLDDKMFEKFQQSDVAMRKVLSTIKIMGRGLQVRNWGLTEQELQANVKKFFEEYK
jgi:hypothetical protein